MSRTFEPAANGVTASRRLLHELAVSAVVAHDVNTRYGVRRAKQGMRGLTRRARKARRLRHARRLQRVSWCSYFEGEKRQGRRA